MCEGVDNTLSKTGKQATAVRLVKIKQTCHGPEPKAKYLAHVTRRVKQLSTARN